MKSIIVIILFLIGFGFAASSTAISEEVRPDCSKKELSTPEEALCMQKYYLDADKELNAVYALVIQQIRETSKDSKPLASWEKSLREAQRTWVKFRDLDCGVVEFEWLGGSGQNYARWFCYLNITQQRTAELRNRYSIPKNK